MMSRLRRPRKSIFNRPRSSTPCISYWVTTGASSIGFPGLWLSLDRQVLGERVFGDHHRRGMNAVLAAKAFEARATSTTRFTSESVSTIWRSSDAIL